MIVSRGVLRECQLGNLLIEDSAPHRLKGSRMPLILRKRAAKGSSASGRHEAFHPILYQCTFRKEGSMKVQRNVPCVEDWWSA